MNYDPGLLLRLAKLVEAKPSSDVLLIDQIQIPDTARGQIIDHLKLLVEAHFILATVQYAGDRAIEVRITSPTLKAQQFLVFARDNEWWKNFLRHARSDDAGLVTREGFLLALANYFPNYL